MSDLYDRLESRTVAARESTLFRDLRHVLTIAKPRVPALRAQLRGIDVAALATRADLARVPMRRRGDVVGLQAESPPFGGINATRLGALRHAFVGSDELLSVEGQARDWWGMGRALFAAGLRKGMLVLNCFPYDLVPDGHVAASGALAVGCPVIPAGSASIDRKVDAIVRLHPAFFCGRADEFKAILDRAADRRVDTSCIKNALVTGSTTKGLRNEFSLRGFNVRHVFMTTELGIIAFESGATDGMTINEGLIIEIVDPTTRQPVKAGIAGEVVVTRINADCPMVRYATGMLSAVCAHPASCGRTNMRIALPQAHAPDFVDMCGRRIHIGDILEIAKRTPGAGRISMVTRRHRGNDEAHLRVEHVDGDTFAQHLTDIFLEVTRLRGTIEIVAPGTLSDDDATILDERPLN